MGDNEVVITYESLYELLRRERYRPELQRLDTSFYSNALNYLKEKQAILNSQEGKDSIFAGSEIDKTRVQLRNVQKILRDIYEKREEKIVRLAIFNSRNNASVQNESALLPEEEGIFGSVKGVLSQYRGGILHNLLSSSAPELPVKKEKALKTDGEIDKVNPGFIKVRIMASVPDFVGPDMNIYGPFEKGAVVELPKDISDVLTANSHAEITE